MADDVLAGNVLVEIKATNADFRKKIAESIADLEGLTDYIKMYGRDMAVVGGVIAAVGASIGFALKSAIGEAAESEVVGRKLQTAIEKSGNSWDIAKPKVDAFLSSIMATTIYTDEQAAVALKSLMFYTKDLEEGFKGARLALDMTAEGMFTATAAARYIGMAMSGNVEMLGRYIPELRIKNNEELKGMTITEKSAYAMKLLTTAFGGRAPQDLKTFTGASTQLFNQLKEITETIGYAFIPALTKLSQKLTEYAKIIVEFLKNHKYITAAIAATAVAFSALALAVGGLLVGALALPTLISAFEWLSIILLTQVVPAVTSVNLALGIGPLGLLGLLYVLGVTLKRNIDEWHAWVNVFTYVKESLADLVDKLNDAINNKLKGFREFVGDIIDKTKAQSVETNFGKLGTIVKRILDQMGEAAEAADNKIKALRRTLMPYEKVREGSFGISGTWEEPLPLPEPPYELGAAGRASKRKREAADLAEYESYKKREQQISKQYADKKYDDEFGLFGATEEEKAAFAIEMALITEAEIAKNKELSEKKSLDEMIQNTRGWNSKQLVEYAKFLQEKAKLYLIDDAMRKVLLDEAAAAIEKSYNLEIQKIQEIGNAFDALGNLIHQFDAKLGGIVSKISNITSSIAQMKLSIPGSWGEFAGGLGIVGSYMSIMAMIFEKSENSNRKIAEAMQYQNSLIEKQINLLHRAKGEEELAGRYDLLVAINKQLEKNKQNLLDIQVVTLSGRKVRLGDIFGEDVAAILAGGEFKTTKFGLGGADFFVMSKETRIILNNLIKDIGNAEQALFDYGEELKQVLTGTTAESIADSITEGFMRGLGTAEVFADNFESLMRNAILNAFKAQIMSQALQPWYETFAEFAKGGLTKEEIQQLGIQLGQDLTWMRGLFEGAEEVMKSVGLDLTEPITGAKRQGLAGAIAGITEQTAGILEGQMQGLFMNVVDIKSLISKNVVAHLHSIWCLLIDVKDNSSQILSIALENLAANEETARNTRNLKYLQSIDYKLESLTGLRGVVY